MSQGASCKHPEHRYKWFVQDRKCNYSAFNGWHRTPSEYSAVWCPLCPTQWRTKAAYVNTLPDGDVNTIQLPGQHPGKMVQD
jgi:hypothetical protein